MSKMLDKLERVAEIAERFQGFAAMMDKIPRFAEMLGVGLFAGRASENIGGNFVDGAIGGVIADGLAHSNLPNNQVGGIALGAYFAGLGLLNLPKIDGIELPLTPSLLDFAPALEEGQEYRDVVLPVQDCNAAGGEVISVFGTQGHVVCRLRS